MENNLLVMIAGVVLSLAFGYVPGLREWYAALDGVRKAQVMAGVLLVAAGGVFAAACYSPWQFATCDETGFWQLVELFIAALIANQATYQIAVRPGSASEDATS
jgi:hypothetical protein